MEKPQDLNQTILLDGLGHHIISWIFRLGYCNLTSQIQGDFVFGIYQFQQIIRQNMLQKQMESMTVIMMPQMAEFMQQNIILQSPRKTDYIQIKIDIIPGRAAAPIGRIMLDCHLIICKAISRCKFG